MTDNNNSSNGGGENGIELDGEFYGWHLSDIGKDLMLIDRISGMSMTEFFEVADDPVAQERVPILLALIATSIRHKHHDWSVERIFRRVMDLSLSADVKMIAGDSEEDTNPLDVAPETPPPSGESARSPSNVSSLPSTPPETSTLETSSASLP